MLPLIESLAISLVLTLVFELLFALVWGVRGKGLVLVILMNVLTNPAVVVLHHLTGWIYILEIAAILVEGFCCRGMIKKPWLFAVCVNVFSYTAGEILQLIF